MWNFSSHTNTKKQNDGMQICMISQKKLQPPFATKRMRKAEKIK